MSALLDRLICRVDVGEDCWEWQGALRNGYGAIGAGNRVLYTHRVVYEATVAPIPAGLVIDHLCRNRKCCNPDHLEVVTRGENVRRGDRVGLRVTACHRGHPYTPENTYTNPRGYRSCRTCRRDRRAA